MYFFLYMYKGIWIYVHWAGLIFLLVCFADSDGENKRSCSSSTSGTSITSVSDVAPRSRCFLLTGFWSIIQTENHLKWNSGGKCGFQGESTAANGQRGRSVTEGRNQRPKTFFSFSSQEGEASLFVTSSEAKQSN